MSDVSWLVFDEDAFINNFVDVFNNASTTLSKDGHIVLMSTPNDKNSFRYGIVKASNTPLSSFTSLEMKWYSDPRYNKFLFFIKNIEKYDLDLPMEIEITDTDGTIIYNDKFFQELINDGWRPISPWYIKMCELFTNNSKKITQELDGEYL